jgi:hypothetical protein
VSTKLATVLSRSFSIAGASWSILRRHPQLLILPAVSAAALCGAMAVFVLVAGGFEPAARLVYHSIKFKGLHSLPGIVGFVAAGWLLNCVSLFFSAAMVSCLLRGFAGESPSIGAGLAAARARLPQIIGWSFVLSVVGILISFGREWLGDKLGFLGNLVGDAVGVGFAAVSFFCLPVIVAEGIGPIDAVKRSSAILRRTWGEALVATAGQTALGLVLGLPAIAAVGVGMWLVHAGTGGAVASILFAGTLVYVAILMTLYGAFDAIYRTGLYVYATTGRAPLDAALLKGAFSPKAAQ